MLLTSLVDPVVGVVAPVAELGFLEPEADLVGGGLNGVGAVTDVAADVDAEVTADGAGLRVEGLGGTEHLAASGDGVVTLPDHSADWARGSVLNETLEETLAGEVRVVLLEVGSTWSAKLHGDQLEALSLESLNDLSNESSLDTIRLDHDESSFLGGSLDHSVKVLQRI